MALINSVNLPLEMQAPSFHLLDTLSNKKLSLEELKSPIATVIMFICNHCPYVKHIQTGLSRLAKTYSDKTISFIAINSNDAESYPEDSPEKMKEIAKEFNYPFPYLYDETQEVAKKYKAQCTPEFYVFDDKLQCVYHGQFDDSRPGNGIAVTGKDIALTLNRLLRGEDALENQIPSIGCSIKWKPEK